MRTFVSIPVHFELNETTFVQKRFLFWSFTRKKMTTKKLTEWFEKEVSQVHDKANGFQIDGLDTVSIRDRESRVNGDYEVFLSGIGRYFMFHGDHQYDNYEAFLEKKKILEKNGFIQCTNNHEKYKNKNYLNSQPVKALSNAAG